MLKLFASVGRRILPKALFNSCYPVLTTLLGHHAVSQQKREKTAFQSEGVEFMNVLYKEPMSANNHFHSAMCDDVLYVASFVSER